MNISKGVIHTINVLLQPYGTSLPDLITPKVSESSKPTNYLTLEEASDRIGYKEHSLREEAKESRLCTIKGAAKQSHHRVSEEELDKWFKNR